MLTSMDGVSGCLASAGGTETVHIGDSTAAPAVGTLAGHERYELRELVGRGGMGFVWRGQDRLLRREVAVKVVVAPAGLDAAQSVSAHAMALLEARAAAQVSHPNAVRVYDVLDLPAYPWIVMEYVASRSLQQMIAGDGPVVPGYAAGVGLALLDALCAAHRVGVVHGDVKPGNVLLGHDGRVVLTDFGVAVWAGAGEDRSPAMGTPPYVPPERLVSGLSLPEGDLWSLGATLYAAVEGRPPYAGDSVTTVLTAVITKPPAPPRYAGDLGPILCDLLRREPDERPSIAETRQRLRRVADAWR
jgi:serine/threonine protein kinase